MTAEGTGFDTGELYQLFGESLFAQNNEEVAELAEKVRESREQYMKLINRVSAEDDTNFYGVLVFESVDMRDEFCRAAGLRENKFLDGRRVVDTIRQLKGEEAKPTGDEGAIKGNNPVKDETERAGEKVG